MKRSYSFPSVYEETSIDHFKIADNFLDGMKIVKFNQRDYLIGNLALSEGIYPHKFLNSSASDIDYQLLALTSLIIATHGKYERIIATVGFPYVTQAIYKKGAIEFLQGKHQVSFDTRTFGGSGIETLNVNIEKVEVITEIDGCIKAIREGQSAEKGNFFIGSLGFGSFELALSTPAGVVQRTTHSERGIHYAVNILENEIRKEFYINLSEQQIERAFQRGHFVINRRRVDISNIRKHALNCYYSEVISTAMRKKFLDEDFLKTKKMYLTGGGALYSELVELFQEEFKGILDVIVLDQPNLFASEGYCLHSIGSSENFSTLETSDNTAYVGIDVGNSNTVITVFTPND